MNAKSFAPSANADAGRSNVVALPVRQRRERDFGVGYGSSSGYAASRRYVNDWGLSRFRCA